MNIRIKENNCPKCGHMIDACTAIEEGTTPSPGDITICFYCGEILAFSEDMSIKEISKEEFESYDSDLKEVVLYAQKVIREK